jgi:hypothetical protein
VTSRPGPAAEVAQYLALESVRNVASNAVSQADTLTQGPWEHLTSFSMTRTQQMWPKSILSIELEGGMMLPYTIDQMILALFSKTRLVE